jgi:hypothetical protein
LLASLSLADVLAEPGETLLPTEPTASDTTTTVASVDTSTSSVSDTGIAADPFKGLLDEQNRSTLI